MNPLSLLTGLEVYTMVTFLRHLLQLVKRRHVTPYSCVCVWWGGGGLGVGG